MEYRRLGSSGLKVSALSFGSWVTFKFQADDSVAEELIQTAYDAGVNFFDNAEVYAAGESERIMGRVLKKVGWGRDTYCVSSKVFWGGDLPTQRGLSRKQLHRALAITPLGKALSARMVEDTAEIAPTESFFTRPTAAESTPDYRSFWHGKKRLPTEIEPATPAAVPAILVKKGGDYPAFWDKDASFVAVMGELYLRVREKNKGVL